MSKQELRKKYIKERKSFSSGKVESASLKVFQQVIKYMASLNSSISKVFLYYPYKNELNIFKHFKTNKKYKLFLPHCINANDMEFKQYSSEEDLEKDHHGIYSPKKDLESHLPDKNSLIIVPCVSVSETGYRIGYGAGFYDKFLSKHKNNIDQRNVICICFEKFLTKTDLSDSWDVKIEVIITENRTLVLPYGT